jgi:NAD(P)-dependent dehydrogenase (short-subunit alcohol dehydrogenase family)
MRRVLITGAARRIGADIARGLAADGWQVIAHYHSSGEAAAALADEIVRAGGRCGTIQADLADRAQVAALIPACVARFGQLDALVNNASSFRYDSLETMRPEGWDAQLAANLEAPVFLARAFARQHGGGEGAVINLLDHKVTAPNPDFFSYTVAKMALAGATRLLAQALAQDGGRIRVNGVAPGITLLSGKQTEAGFKRAWAAPPLGRSSTPAELVEACRYILATPSLNGQILVLDGGDALLGRLRDVAFEEKKEGLLF